MPRLMFQRPRRIEWEDLTTTFGRMTAEPFEKGYALTVGGSLRRVLLSAIPGTAPVWVKVAGVSAERVSGVEEDLAHLLLNLKKMVVRLAGNAETGSAHLEVRGPRVATGADFAGEGMGCDAGAPATVAAGEARRRRHPRRPGYVSADRHGDAPPVAWTRRSRRSGG
jgi:DNA-directed RNA polymerase alpha subunit